MEIYVVRQGDYLGSIGTRFGVGTAELAYANQLPYPYYLAVGQALLIPNGSSPDEGKRTVMTRGFAYPFISGWVLEQTLPYLTDLAVFSYGFTMNGDLLPPYWDDTWMINLAAEYGTVSILTLTPLDERGMFNSYMITALLSNPAAQKNLIGQVLETMRYKNFSGLDIDFEFISAEDRVRFAQFVEDVKQAVAPEGYSVSVDLAPKIASDQQGELYEGKDYGLLGKAADKVLLMTYEWGYTYGPPMGIAPINKVREVVEYAVTEIPPEKINLGIPNYGYDWTLPYVKGQSKAVTIGNVEAVQIAVQNQAEIMFDEVAMSPYFNYMKDGATHEVWFEDVRSIQAKFKLINEYGLNGAGYWQIMQLFRTNWLLAADTFNIQKE
ncbi:MAG: LysM peptidoglycan-binding domain-containing protein [Lachnospiraceae bacterium]|nr:LysM peptidoglycan-binding domain-containing protein [Lachnospiraceae bacterium]